MKVTEALKKELLQWFETFWSTYLKGDIDTWSNFIREDYKNIGGTEVELWNSKQEIIEYTYTIMDQFLGTADIRNREIEVIPYGDYLMVHEFTDLYIKIDGEWSFYAPFRMSSLMEKTNTGWITFHQHGSYPDMKALEGEAFSIDALKAENIKLQEGIKARTLELEEKNRELEIEAALERIRSRSMAMQSTNELSDVILVLFKQLELLGIVIDTCYIDIFDKDNQSFNVYIGTGTAIYPEQVTIPYSNHPIHQLNKRAREDNLEFFTFDEDKKSKDMYFEHFYPNAKGIKVPEERKALIAKGLGMTGSTALGEQSGMAMFNYRKIIYSEEENDILVRVNKVFQQTYIRFLDLQRAEKQAKEAKIEAALERIRASTMAMHKSHELAGVVKRINRELLNLNIHLDTTQILTDITNNPQKGFNIWIAVDGMDYLHKFHFPYLDHAITQSFYKNQEKQIAFYSEQIGKEEKNSYFKLVFKYSDFKTIPKERQKLVFDAPGWTRGVVFLNNSILILSRYKKEAFNEEETEIFVRIGKVFEQAYTRFLDLQKAEEQSRESQIEAALERVRSTSMAMHKSSDLKNVITAVFEQMEILEIPTDSAQIIVHKEGSKDFYLWAYSPGEDYSEQIYIPYLKNPVFDDYWNNINCGPFSMHYAKIQKDEFFQTVFLSLQLRDISEERKKLVFDAAGMNRAFVAIDKAGIAILNYRNIFYSQEVGNILVRLLDVFNQAYTRFLDLQKAENQARESQIEAALERVRSKAMAMHHTDDLSHTIEAFYEQLSSLIDSKVVRCGAGLLSKETTMGEIISASRNSDGENHSVLGTVDMKGLPLLENTYKAWLRQKEYHHILKGNEIKAYYQHMTNQLALPDNNTDDELHFYFPMFAEGSFYMVTESELPQKELVILRRFSSVLSLTYRRFNDLNKAEVQARESQIEAAIERVRSRSMAMHKSSELRDVVSTLHNELRGLNVNFHVACIQLLIDKSKDLYLWIGTADGLYSDLIYWPYTDIRVLNEMHEAKLKKSNAEIHLTKAETKAFLHEYFKLEGVPQERKATLASVELIDFIGYYQDNTSIFLMRYTEGSYTEDEKMITERFSKVFEQTYTRFLDLQKAEAREREAIKQASLDRVRGEIASMRTAKDLERITPLVWKELTALGVPFFRCGVFIIREDEEMVHAYLSTPDGKSVAALHLPFSDRDTQLIIPAVENWRKQKPYKEEWDQEQFINQTRSFMEKGQIENPQSYQVMDTPPERLVLHLVPFRQGMLYVGHSEDLNQEQLTLVESLALTFSVAYSRYEDFKALEDTKNSLELTLKDLKSTQTQLIQSEKMASLGELTAGIAHEIQNPLNFVNNFSEVSKELLEEMLEDLKNGDMEEVDAIATDVIANLEKILHHGKRADAIVKGMLEHSRTNKGEKNPTDINALIDEFVRLSYHGLRAKNKSFNADYKLDFDANLPKVNVISPDIGRVILNLVNNAFFAVNEKAKVAAEGYNPEIKIQSKTTKTGIQLSIDDNGDGIPKNILDKIFQPFFTTKPTGQGTGLGLSLSYDIIKAHGGTLNVESEEGKGTRFAVNLPVNS